VRLAALLVLGGCSFGVPALGGSDAHDDSPKADTGPDAPPAPACFASRCRRITITVDHTQVIGGPHAAFPLYVEVSDLLLDRGAVFTADDGVTTLAYEREALRSGVLLAWVRVPMLPSDHDTVIYLYTGDASAPDADMRTAVWDAGFQAVWHAGATDTGALTITDSTSHANHGTDTGGLAVGTTAKLGRGLTFDGVDDAFQVPGSASLASSGALGTLELWTNWANVMPTGYERILMTPNTLGGDGSGMEWSINSINQYYYYPAAAGGANYAGISVPFTVGAWFHVAVTQDLSTKTVRMYVNGAERMKEMDGAATLWGSTPSQADWFWGGKPGSARYAGQMDEIRVSNVVRSPGWIATEFANQNTPASFYSLVATGP